MAQFTAFIHVIHPVTGKSSTVRLTPNVAAIVVRVCEEAGVRAKIYAARSF